MPLAGRHPRVQAGGDRAARVPEGEIPHRGQAVAVGAGALDELRDRDRTLQAGHGLEGLGVPGRQLRHAEGPIGVPPLGPVQPGVVPARHGEHVAGHVRRRPLPTGAAGPAVRAQPLGPPGEGVDPFVIEAEDAVSRNRLHPRTLARDRAGGAASRRPSSISTPISQDTTPRSQDTRRDGDTDRDQEESAGALTPTAETRPQPLAELQAGQGQPHADNPDDKCGNDHIDV